MIEYPTDETVETIRNLILLCKNNDIVSIKVGPIELSFEKEIPKRKEMSEEERKLLDLEYQYGASGMVPVDLQRFREGA